jgi:dUTP pyrophosphatase
MNTEIKIMLLHPNAVMPTKANPGDAAFDLTATSQGYKEGFIANGFIEYGLGIASEIPEGWAAFIYPRSSNSGKDLLLCNSVAVIDSSYRGEWKVRFRIQQAFDEAEGMVPVGACPLLCFPPKLYSVGDRVAQVIFQKLPEVTLTQAGSLSETERGTGGFGSSGR